MTSAKTWRDHLCHTHHHAERISHDTLVFLDHKEFGEPVILNRNKLRHADTNPDDSEKESLMKGIRPSDRPTRPRSPSPSDCCGTGCDVCVWTVYHDAMADYDADMMAWKADNGISDSCDSDDD